MNDCNYWGLIKDSQRVSHIDIKIVKNYGVVFQKDTQTNNQSFDEEGTLSNFDKGSFIHTQFQDTLFTTHSMSASQNIYWCSEM